MATSNESSETPFECRGAPATDRLTVVGLGASAGGIQALQTFFTALPAHPGIVFVVIMHLSSTHESHLTQVLQVHTAMPVTQVQRRVRMEPDHVYVIPPNQQLVITDGHLILTDFAAPPAHRAPIDAFFRTLAAHHPDGIGILLSGGGTDGTVGMKAIKEHGGILMVQSPEEAEYATMPRSAIATGLIDFILPAAALADKLLELRQDSWPSRLRERREVLPAPETDAVSMILRLLQSSTGHDFGGYKLPTVQRRLERRMCVVQVESLTLYYDYLRTHPAELPALFRDLLISVTTFFRDAVAFEALQTQVIPGLFAGKAPDDEVRVWVPGCATGEEAYSLAILLLEQAETLAAPPRLQLFASDLNEDALLYARAGLYPNVIAADVSEARLQRFFVPEGAYYRVRKELRDLILFTPHSLLKDPPFSHLNLISCRNLLIYLQRALQEKIAALFHYALQPQGVLFLGGAESLEGITTLFHAIDKTHRLYRRAPLHSPVRQPDLPLALSTSGRMPLSSSRSLSPQQVASDAKRHRQVLEAYAPPSLLVDADATIVHVSETATRYLQFPSGSPSSNLYRAALPELRLELRIALPRALTHHEATLSAPLPAVIQGTHRFVQLYIAPTRREQAPPQALVVFLEANLPVSDTRQAQAPGSSTVDPLLHQLETELAAVKTQLQDTIEAAETHQEELKAANEELQSINEEYKSTLEELETSKEELQSINEELTTVNQELQARLKDLSQSNNNLHNLIAVTDVGILFVDRQLTIQFYTPPLAQLFSLMPVDQGRPLAHVTHRFGALPLLHDLQKTLETLEPSEREVQRDDGRHYLLRLSPYLTSAGQPDGVVLTFVDITPLKRATQQMREREEQFRQQEKLAALGALLANVAHELNNPLAVASLQVENLQETRGPGPWSEDLEILRQAIERCQRVVQSFLALARQEPPTRQAVALHTVLGDVLVLLQDSLEADNITIERDLGADLPLLWADADQLHHVVANLVTNAHHALRESAPPRHLQLTTAATADRRYVSLRVTDNGPGIPLELQRRVFEPFFTTKPQGKGNGLGLPLCRSIVEGHGGTIQLLSQSGQGTTVHITLPAAAPAVVTPEAPPAPEVLPQAQRGAVLLIDDELGVQQALGRLLQRSGYHITLASSGCEGLAALAAGSYEVILCDMHLPDLDGPGLYHELERRYPHLLSQVIFLTGDVLSLEVQAFFDQVKCPHLWKPFSAHEVRRVIQQVLEAR